MSRPGTGGSLTFTGAYDATGSLVRQDLPGGITATSQRNLLGPEPGGTGTSEVGKAVPYDRAYSYDGAGRLVRVADRVGHGQGAPAGLGPDTPATPAAPCYVRTYAFDGPAGLNGSRTGESFAISTDGDCANPAPAYKATATYSYDAADRPVSGKAVEGAAAPGAYTYDAFGRQTTVPASDAPNRDAGDITIGYFDTDLARTVTQGATSTELTLDSAGRRANQTTTDATSVTKTVVRHYTDESDNPSWVEETKPGQGTTTTRFVEGVSSELGAMITDTGEATVNLSNPHGDNVSSVTVAADQATDVPCTSMGGWSDYTEFGQPYGFTPVNDPAVVGPIGYGWLGAQQRSNTTDTAGLTLMGVRLYNPATGAFTTPDPVYGGNDTAYTYPQDPINSFDLDGKWGWRGIRKGWNRLTRAATGNSKWAKRFRTGCSWMPSVAGTACGGFYTAAYAGRNRREAAKWGLSTLTSSFGGNYARKLMNSGLKATRAPRQRLVRKVTRPRQFFRNFWRHPKRFERGVGFVSGNAHGSALGGSSVQSGPWGGGDVGKRFPSESWLSVVFPAWPGFLMFLLIVVLYWPAWGDGEGIWGLGIASVLCAFRIVTDSATVRFNWVQVGRGSISISAGKCPYVRFDVVPIETIERVEWIWGTRWFYNISPSSDRGCEFSIQTDSGTSYSVDLLLPNSRARWRALRCLGEALVGAEWIVDGESWDPRRDPLGPKPQRWTSIWGLLR
ncbi:RHS repeat-associated protein [Barrientosiimonas humi]|uniref:RHS repeat-associated protein n=1 Tax=Barrientosiimonas humi TaxID=999931 RepID=A0A542XF94_9MICO|nr:RHS repeat-associated protein [Barrientosiimonas humi]CAG7574477.1 hypothetical protein BH39T_PBIAJDOK_03132 [Barrientosiimonas humi]